MSKWDVMRINLAAGLVAGGLVGLAEIAAVEIRTRVAAKAVVAHATDIGEKTATGEPGE